jgi:hypothetical protein
MKLDEAYKIAGVITEDSLNRLQEVHRKNGYAIVSACRNEFTKEENEKRTNQLKEILQKSSFSFKKVLGGFIETKEDGSKKEVKEKSFIIYNYDKNGNIAEKDKLFKFALQICKKFNQDSILYSEKGDKPRYYTQQGKVDSSFSNAGFTFNDKKQQYFTDFSKNKRFTLNWVEPREDRRKMTHRAKKIIFSKNFQKGL